MAERAGGSGDGVLAGDTPALRLFSLLELISAKDQYVSLQGLVDETGVPKPTLHRMLQQLEGAGLLVRQSDGRHYGLGARARVFAETLLFNAVQAGARHAVLRELVEQTGETCNLTAVSGDEVIYLDRVETEAPLRVQLRAGSRVPIHASASGKRYLAQLSPEQRARLLGHATLKGFTDTTITSLEALDRELDLVSEQGFAIDDEEYVPGLVCIAVLVPSRTERSSLCLAMQAPAVRVSKDSAPDHLPALRAAAQKIATIEREGSL